MELQPRSQDSFLPQLDSTCLNDGIVIKIKKPFIGNGIQTYNHFVCKRTLNHLVKLA